MISIVFSRNRALQCDSLLRSIADHWRGDFDVHVIYSATTDLHVAAYAKLQQVHPRVHFHPEGALGLGPVLEALLATVSLDDLVCLNVDDLVYYRPTYLSVAASQLAAGAFVFSWRLGVVPGLARWATYWWSYGVDDPHYGYLWHTDGAVYRAGAYRDRLMTDFPDWARKPRLTPNDLEAAAAVTRHRWGAKLRHAGPLTATCMTWQINKESTVEGRYGAPWCTVAGLTDLDSLAHRFLAGARVDNDALYHDLSWTTRFQGATSFPTHVRACEEASRFYASIIK